MTPTTQKSLDAEPRGSTGTEEALARLLADVAHLDDVPLDSHFFDELGTDSLVMAHFCARVRNGATCPTCR